MAKKVSEDPLVRFAQEHGGNLRPMTRVKRGTSYLYTYYSGGLPSYKNFPAGTPPARIIKYILEVQGNEFLSKSGYEAIFTQEERERNRLTLAQLLDWYLEITLREKAGLKSPRREVRLESAKRSARSYEYACMLFEKFLESELRNRNFPVEDLELQHLNDFMRWLLAYDGGRGGHNANTINAILGRITAIFKRARYEKKLPAYKFEGLKKLKREPVKAHLILTPEEMRQIGERGYLERKTNMLRGTEREDFEWRMQIWWAYQIARFTAMRAQDIRRLRWQDFNFETCEYHIEMAKTHNQVRMPFHPNLLKYREEYFRRLGKVPEGAAMFKLGEKELNHRFRGAIVDLKGETGLSCGSHSFRHAWATYLNNTLLWPEEDVGMFLCHDSGNITHRYTHERIERIRGKIATLPLE